MTRGRGTRLGVQVLLVAALFGCRRTSRPGVVPEEALFSRMADEYVSERARFYPVEATAAGYRGRDGDLGTYTSAAFQARLAWLHDFRQRLLGVDLTRLSRAGYIEALLLTAAVKGETHDLSEVAQWKRSPGFYVEIIRLGLLSLLQPEPSPESGLDSLLSRLRQIPSVVDAARSNLAEPPLPLVEEGILDLEECRRLIEGLPATLGKELAPSELASLGRESREASRSIQELIDHLETRRRAGDSKPFALGAENLRRQFLYLEMEDTALEELGSAAERDLWNMKMQLDDIAGRLDPSRPPKAVLETLSKDQSPAQDWIAFADATVQKLRRFTVERDLFRDVPETGIRLAEAPPWLRLEAPFHLHSPGPMEDQGASAFLIALAPSDVPIKDQIQSLGRRALELSVIREVYPGRHLHLSSQRASPSRLRKLLTSKANREGWILYAEQMTLDEGFGWDDPGLRAMQLRDALLESCRLLTAIGLHAQGMSLSEATRLFQEAAYLDPERAQREARSIAADPVRAASAGLGRAAILRMRADFLEPAHPDRTLRDFHDAFLAASALPLKLVHLTLLPEEP